MKKLIAILALMAMGSAAMAQFTVDTSVDGQATINVPDGVLGLGLDVTVSTGTLDSVEVNGFNVYIDEAWEDFANLTPEQIKALPDVNADDISDTVQERPLANVMDRGVAALSDNFAICAGFLAANNPGTSGATIVLKAADGADVIISKNAKRGGVVNAAGSVDFTELVFTIDAAGNPNFAMGDLNGDNEVTWLDIQIVLDNWNKTTPEAIAAADCSGDGEVTWLDIQIILDNWNRSF